MSGPHDNNRCSACGANDDKHAPDCRFVIVGAKVGNPVVSSSSLLLTSIFICFQEDEIYDELTEKVMLFHGQKLLMPEVKAVFTSRSDADIYAKQFNCVVEEFPVNKYKPATWTAGQTGYKLHVRGPTNSVAVFDCYGPPEPSMEEWQDDPLEPLSAIAQVWARDAKHAKEIGLAKAADIREKWNAFKKQGGK